MEKDWWYADLIKWAISTKSPWTIIAALIVGLVSMVIMGILVHKAQKLAKERAELKKEEERIKQMEEEALLTTETNKVKVLENEITEAKRKLTKTENTLKELKEDYNKKITELERATSWEDL